MSDPTELTRFSYRVKDAASHLGMSKSKLWELIAEGRIPARKLTAGITVIRREDIIAFLDGDKHNQVVSSLGIEDAAPQPRLSYPKARPTQKPGSPRAEADQSGQGQRLTR